MLSNFTGPLPAQGPIFGNDLIAQLDPGDRLMLSEAVDWSRFDDELSRHYSPDRCNALIQELRRESPADVAAVYDYPRLSSRIRQTGLAAGVSAGATNGIRFGFSRVTESRDQLSDA